MLEAGSPALDHGLGVFAVTCFRHTTLSKVTDEHDPTAFQAIMEHFRFAKDGLGIAGFDPDGHGVYLVAALPKVTTLSKGARERWQMVAANLGAGYRLRRAIESTALEAGTGDELPFGAEAIIDSANFRVTEAEVRRGPGLHCLLFAMRRSKSTWRAASFGRATRARHFRCGLHW